MGTQMQRHLHIVLFCLLAAAASTALDQALPGCPNTCGNLTNIPFPFGTKQGCYLNESYLINCNQSTPYLGTGNLQVTNISVDGQVEILQFVARDCYDQSGLRVESNSPWLSLASTYSISDTQNKFIAIGCDTFTTVTGNIRGTETYSTGCMSYCHTRPTNDTFANLNGSCSGIGCCKVSIPSGLTNMSISVWSQDNHTLVRDFNPCSYAFVGDESDFNFSFQKFDELKNVESLPLVLDWTIGIDEPCQTAKEKPDYACKLNSECYNPRNDSGYRCKCKDGYQGNPYLSPPNGCQAIGVSLLVVLVGGLWLLFIYHKRKLLKLERKFFEQNGGKMLQQELNERQLSNATRLIYTAEELKEATNNYDESSIIGKGGFGTVYKGFLKSNGLEIAIKKPKTFDPSQAKTFIYEFIFLSQINHPNVVKLLGCCLEREVPLLVYEYIPNGTLYDHIHKKNSAAASPMSWQVRLRIAIETAEALASLHSTTPPIIHRDVKPHNILLDDNYTAKVSDFGASRLMPIDQTELATMVQGTFGYLDPEYFHTGQFTEKSDVYSFGVVLVELLTSKRAVSFDGPEQERSLVNLFLYSFSERDHHHHGLVQILDDQVAKEAEAVEQIKNVAELAKRCLSVRGERPRMEDVAMELKGLRMMGEHPWVEIEVKSEEKEHLLVGNSSLVSTVSNNGYDNSINIQGAFEISDGR